jgi:hypothetical protein
MTSRPDKPRVVVSVVRAVVGTLAFSALALVMIWPLLSPTRDVLPDSDDAYFSAWRLAWVAHQLPKDPLHLFDANVFYPAGGTLAFSDAMLLPSIVGAPLSWAGVRISLVHNLLLWAALVSSMCLAFLLARELTGSWRAGWMASIIFGLAPYRFAHIGHLELQWIVWMPLSLLLLHRFFNEPTAAKAIGLGFAITAQTFSSIYYGVFLTCYVAVAWLVLFAITKSGRRRVLTLTPLVALPLLLVVVIYGPVYARTRAEQGPRNLSEVSQFSATPSDFLRVPPHNRLRGRPNNSGPAPDERSLYPGTVALVLAAAALLTRPRRLVWMYLALTFASIDASLGMNGFFFPAIQQLVPLATSFRSPARFGALFLLSVSVLAGFGTAALLRARPRWATALLGVATIVCVGEYWSAPVRVRPGQSTPTEGHRALSYQPAGTVVLEMPVPRPEALWLYETTYQLRSIHHWQPLINGYSGFAPHEYVRTLELLSGFPDAVSVERLRDLQVRFIVLNRVYYSGEEFTALIGALSASPSFWPPQSYGAGDDQLVIVELKKSSP